MKKNSNQFSFVILHYNTIEDTKECVESIKSIDDQDNIKIVIVDNASPNNTGKELEKLYSKDKQIKIILSKENLGFARGNNLGFEYAKYKLKSDFIILCNSDTIILQKDFNDKIEKAYSKYNFAVMGPKIKLLDGSLSSYILDHSPSIKDVNNIIKTNNIIYYKKKFNLEKIHFRKLFKRNNVHDDSKLLELKKDVTLHGCFLIFSKNYIDKFDGLNDKTFMYGEEVLLQIRINNNNLISLYNPEIEIVHKEGSATKTLKKNKMKKAKFQRESNIKAMKIAKEELKHNDNKIKIYIAAHKKADFPNNNIYYPIQVGSEGKIDLGFLKDNTGDQISKKNPNYCELTGLYWIWKNDKESEIVGLCHYRRYFFNVRFNNKLNNVLSKKKINKLLKKYDVILPSPYYFNNTIYENYKEYHKIEDLDECKKIIEEKFPDYKTSYNKVMKRKYIYAYNMFVMPKDKFDSYMSWLFEILFELEKRIDISKYDDYQKRVFGFLSERLFNVWIYHNKLRVKNISVYNTETKVVNQVKDNIKNLVLGKIK